ncbi:MAG: helix-turn-helix transcriptional regulator [Candidatus Aminicenantes bacterium]|nr:helix-turn-helix transcriptional regulator [Candidatus Aminicenantes bacterium]
MSDTDTKFETEMNRGFLQVLVLVVLEEAMYGYMMLRKFEQLGYKVEESTLYPLLRRLEKYELVESKWDVSADRPKKFYEISEKGRRIRQKLLKIWQQQDFILKNLSQEDI